METQPRIVLACIDGSKLSEAVCDYAAWVAKHIDAPLKMLHTIDHHHEKATTLDLSGNIGLDSRDHLLEDIASHEQQKSKIRLQQGKAILQAAKNRAIGDGISDPLTCLQHGNLVESLIELQEQIQILVVGARGKVHEDHPHQIGDKLEAMIRSLHLPILVIYDKFTPPRQVMIAYDGSETADKAVNMIAKSPLSQSFNCIHLVFASPKGASDSLFERPRHKLETSTNADVVCQILLSKPKPALCHYQAEHSIDLTIMGAFSHNRIHDWLLGSFTTKMLINTHTPLLLLR